MGLVNILTNNKGDLELLDTISNSHKFAGTPDETVLFNRTNSSFKSRHVGFIVPRFDVHGNNGL